MVFTSYDKSLLVPFNGFVFYATQERIKVYIHNVFVAIIRLSVRVQVQLKLKGSYYFVQTLHHAPWFRLDGGFYSREASI